jgi:hypothetical protein
MEPQYYPSHDKCVRDQVQQTQDAAWATRVLVYGAINKLPGWPSLWEVLMATRGRKNADSITLLRVFTARAASRIAGWVIETIPQRQQAKLLRAFKKLVE